MELIHTVFLALGSNLGEREIQINMAISQLNSINFNKENLIKESPDNAKQYPPFIINKCMYVTPM